MTSTYIAVSILKQSLSEKQLRIFLSHLQKVQLKEYVHNASIYKGKKNIYIYKHDLTEMIVTGKNKQIIEEINMLLSSITNKKNMR